MIKVPPVLLWFVYAHCDQQGYPIVSRTNHQTRSWLPQLASSTTNGRVWSTPVRGGRDGINY